MLGGDWEVDRSSPGHVLLNPSSSRPPPSTSFSYEHINRAVHRWGRCPGVQPPLPGLLKQWSWQPTLMGAVNRPSLLWFSIFLLHAGFILFLHPPPQPPPLKVFCGHRADVTIHFCPMYSSVTASSHPSSSAVTVCDSPSLRFSVLPYFVLFSSACIFPHGCWSPSEDTQAPHSQCLHLESVFSSPNVALCNPSFHFSLSGHVMYWAS